MSWLNQSLSGLKGQFKNLANEVFSEGIVEDTDPFTELAAANDRIKELQNLCASQDVEIKTLRRQNATLHQEKINAQTKSNGASAEPQSNNSDASSWFWDPPDGQSSSSSKITEITNTEVLQQKIHDLQNEISSMKNVNKNHEKNLNTVELQKEMDILREENKNLTKNLEDLDNENQIAMNKVITIKHELQKNFEDLQTKYKHLEKENDAFKLKFKSPDESENNPNFDKINKVNKKLNADLKTLHHKYDTLEKIHGILKESTEKFQEENMELVEENFRLQEECTKLQNDVEELRNLAQTEGVQENHPDLKQNLTENNLKTVENIKEESHDSKAQEIIAQLKFEIVELQNKLNTNEEIKRLNLEIDHLKKELNTIADDKSKSIPCDAFKNIIDKYMTYDLPGLDKPLKETPRDIINYAELCWKNVLDVREKNTKLEKELLESAKSTKELQANYDELFAEVEILNGDIERYEHECSEHKKNNDFLIAEIGALKSVSKLEPILEHNEEHLAKLQGELDDCCKLNSSIKTEMQDKDKKLENILQEKHDLSEEIKQLKSTIKQFEDNQESFQNISIVQEKFNSSLNEIEKLKSQLHSVTVDYEKSKIDLTIMDNEKILLLRELSELKANLQSKSITEDYVKKLETEKSMLESKLENFGDLEELLKQLKIENTELKQKITSLDDKSGEHVNIMNELRKYKDIQKDNVIKMKEKEAEIENMRSKIISLEKSLQENLIAVSNYNSKFVSECNEISNTLCIDFDILNKPTDQGDVNTYGLKNVDDIFAKIKQFISVLDAKKCELLNETKLVNEKLLETIHQNNCLLKEIETRELKTNELQESLDVLNNEINRKNNENSILVENINKVQSELLAVKNELDLLLSKEKSDETNTSQLVDIINSQKEEISTIKLQNEKILTNLQNEVSNLYEELKKCNEILTIKDTELAMKNDEMQNLNESILKQQKEIEILSKKCNEAINNNENNSINVENNELQELKTKHNELLSELNESKINASELKSQIDSFQEQSEANNHKLTEIETLYSEALRQLEQLNVEKSELINLVTQKHHESVTYHNEIQRLNGILLNENERYKELENIYRAATKEHKMNEAQSHSVEVGKLNELLNERNNRCTELEKQLEYLRSTGVTIEEIEKLREKNVFLIEKCDLLGKNLIIEQSNTKQIVQEKMQILDKEQTMSRELERLRQHLVEMEDEHTRELVNAEQKLQEAQQKLSQAEDKVKQSNTLFTSNSIRANQEVETLRMQVKLVEKQRDEIQAQLSQSEDKNSKNLAALTNLQCVLEQFQMDKEQASEAVAGRARRDLESAHEEISRLQKQISELEEKLRDSSTGLRAASRLSAQLDARTAQVHEAKEQVNKLEEELSQWKKKYKDSVSNQQDKVDKSLVKNLLMGYIQTAVNQKPKDKLQVLRLLSTVLDFDQTECERAGLGSKSSNVGGLGADSLAQEFIKFLEKESQPQLKIGLPNLLHLGSPQGPLTPPHTKTESPRLATNSPQRLTTPSPQLPTSVKPLPIIPMTINNPLLATATVSPVPVESPAPSGNNASGFNNSLTGGFSLFTPIANPDVVVNQTRNNEGAILKNILKES